ncbi:MAG TPA: helix-turn-helix domain-containing protein [Candidatus Limnocylindrales bacterium]|nr:helix-turn-helix domain-containing protein [Candidatus Limnocylindrales bacterium]
MKDAQVGRAIRAVRIRKGWRQQDLAWEAGVAQQTVSRIERGDLAGITLGTLVRVTAALGARISLDVRGDGAEIDRLLGARHSAMHEETARLFERLPAWVLAPEVTFSIYGERGAIDILAWHAATRTLLVIELKTELVDIQETVGTLDRKVRLAARIAADRGWAAETVAVWLVVAESATNRRRVAAHRTMLRSRYPADGRSIAGWLAAPDGAIAALSFLASTRGASASRGLAQVHRVRRPTSRPQLGRT